MTRPAVPPRLLTRTLTATFLASSVVLIVVFLVIALAVQRSVRYGVTETLRTVQQVLSTTETRRSAELHASLRALAQRPTLKAALDTYQSELHWGQPSGDLLVTLRREAQRLADRVDADLVAILDVDGRALASAGITADLATLRAPASETPLEAGDRVVAVESGIALARIVSLELDNARIGWLLVAERLDRGFATRLAAASDAAVAILADGRLWASSLPRPQESRLGEAWMSRPAEDGIVEIPGERYAYRRIMNLGEASIYALGSIDAVAIPAIREARLLVLGLALLALAMSGAASFWLARSISRPIDELSRSVQAMATTRDLGTRLMPTGSSRELDGFTWAFNDLMDALTSADAEVQSAYVAAIRGLAAALDARDPYTAGHSERVSLLSVAVGRQLGLSDTELEVLRIGALLHDIGKIGVPDAVLQKPGRLSTEEYEVIKTHTTLGARILSTVPFLAAHVPIVELHHERPDGRGYPRGLAGDDIPLVAAIVHVADAYDAITTARAYRGARPADAAVSEIRRCTGSDFSAPVVEALVRALPATCLPETASPPARLHLVSARWRDATDTQEQRTG